MRSAKRTVLAGLLLMGMATAVAPGVPLWAAQQAPAGGGPARAGAGAPRRARWARSTPSARSCAGRRPHRADPRASRTGRSTSAMASGMAAGRAPTLRPACRPANRCRCCRGRRSCVDAAAGTRKKTRRIFVCRPASRASRPIRRGSCRTTPSSRRTCSSSTRGPFTPTARSSWTAGHPAELEPSWMRSLDRGVGPGHARHRYRRL